MEHKSAQYFIDQFNTGRLTSEEEIQLEKLIAEGLIELDDLESIKELNDQVEIYYNLQISKSMKTQFADFMDQAQSQQKDSIWQKLTNAWLLLSPNLQMSFGVLSLVIGLGLGFFMRGPHSPTNQEIVNLNDQMQDIQQMFIVSLLHKESTVERLKAVNQTKTMDNVDDKVTDALLYTLNYDENTNVRLAALESLYQYAHKPKVREGLVKAITNQESPMVQVALAEIMVTLEEKRAIESFETLLSRDNTPPDIKSSIQKRLAIML